MTSAVAAAAVFADTWGWHHDGVGSGWWIVMMVGMLAFWALVIYAVVWAFRGSDRFAGGRGAGADRATALDILDRRLAEGDVTPEEYERRRALLEDRGSSRSQSSG